MKRREPEPVYEAYRVPTEYEKSRIIPCVVRRITGEMRPQYFVALMCSVLGGASLLNVVLLSLGRAIGETVFILILGVLAAWAATGRWKMIRELRSIRREIRSGNFEVMDCEVREITSNSHKGRVVVMVKNENGLCCARRMYLDGWAADQYKKGLAPRLLLVRQGEKYKTLVSEYYLEVGNQ